MQIDNFHIVRGPSFSDNSQISIRGGKIIREYY